MDLTWRGFRVPLKHPFRGQTFRQGALIEGPHGWGEYSPFPGYSDRMLANCLEAARSCACEAWPAPVRKKVEVHVTVPAVHPAEAARLVRESGCRAAKVKVAEGDDEPRLEAVRDALGPHGRLVVDANGAWSVDEACRAIQSFRRYGVELVEQPVATVEELAALRRLVDVPLATDELVHSPESVRQIVALGAADVLVIKVQSMGGVARALQAVETAGLPVIVSSLLETSVGIAAGLALAAALPELPYPCGLGTISLLAGDVVAGSLVPENGTLEVRRPPVDIEALGAFEIDPAELPFPPGVVE
jgi:O-succinylbenzoate synthase